MDQLQKEKLLKSKNLVDKIKSKLTIINIVLFGLGLLFMVVGGSAIDLSTRYDSMDISFWQIFGLATETAEAMETRGDAQIASAFSMLAGFTAVLIIVLVVGVVLNLVWRAWDDKKHNEIKNIVAVVFFFIVLIMFFIIITLNLDSTAAVLQGLAFWAIFICSFIAGMLNLMVFVVEKQLAKLETNEQ